ncbi:MAG: DUF1552 domain-containing protein [Myxococcales bacterium]|nr:DUF1552 domain-containing protein [Myxococcales bacterium]
MRRFRLSRRTFLRGAGGIALALPLLEIMRPRAVRAADDAPKRLILWFTANGTVPSAWTPGPNFALGPILEPLAPHKQDLLVLSGLGLNAGGGDKKGHNRGIACLWTGLPPEGGNDGENSYATGPSIDQHIAAKLAGDTQFATLELGVQVKTALPRGRMIYAGAAQPIPPEDDPFKVYTRLFDGLGESAAELEAIRARRKTVLDAVMSDYESLDSKLGAADRIKLEAHLDNLREIELRLDKLYTLPDACEVPDPPPQFNIKNNDRFPELGQLQMDLLVMALACDLTRVASIMWSHALSSVVHTWLGHTEVHHTISHFGDGASNDQLVAINAWYSARLSELITRLKAVPEGDGTLFDRVVICCGSELGKGQPHYNSPIPFVLAGSCGGYFATGRHLDFAGASHNDLLISLMHAMGVQQNTFGDPAHASGPLPGLTG